MKIVHVATALGVAASLVGGSLMLSQDASAKKDQPPACVAVSGGTVSNNTSIDVSANGGTAISDASGGSNNIGVGSQIASAGNGGVADAQANGGAVSLGDVNSGGNMGNAIAVGDTHCAPAAAPAQEAAPVEEVAPVEEAAPVEAAPVVELPSTGVGEFGVDLSMAFSAMAAAAAAVAGGLSVRRRA